MTKVFGGKYKDMVRNYIRPMIKPHMTVFSLPNLNFEIESLAKEAICVEIDSVVYEHQKSICPSNCSLYLGKASEVLELTSKTKRFDFIYLDFCGSISRELFESIGNCKIKRNGKVVISLLKGREHPKWHFLKRKNRLDMYKNIVETYSKGRLHIYQTIEYRDTSPMIVLFCRGSNLKEPKTIKQIKL